MLPLFRIFWNKLPNDTFGTVALIGEPKKAHPITNRHIFIGVLVIFPENWKHFRISGASREMSYRKLVGRFTSRIVIFKLVLLSLISISSQYRSLDCFVLGTN